MTAFYELFTLYHIDTFRLLAGFSMNQIKIFRATEVFPDHQDYDSYVFNNFSVCVFIFFAFCRIGNIRG